MTVAPVTAIEWSVTELGAGRPLLLLHGFTGAAASWEPHLEWFAARFRVLAPDLPGHGGTPPTPDLRAMTVEASAASIASLLVGRGASPADVIGYSMGARVALRLAADDPGAVGRLILESPSAGLADAGERTARRSADEAMADRIERDGIASFVARWERNPIFTSQVPPDPALAELQHSIRLRADPHGLAASLRAAGQGAMTPLHDRLASVVAPTLVVAGAVDSVGRPRAEAVAEGIPNARLAVVDGAGHTPHLDNPHAFARLAFDFLLKELPE
jgi:2-succinyl-6-hydroxy-2,4-cyclohexadiene-1-carboxylate synthase